MSDRGRQVEADLPPEDAITERELSPEEFEAWVQAPVSPEERENARALIEWFLRRYPTPAARLGYIRRHALAARSRRRKPSR